ncbi:MAG: hypothetical protein AB7U47_12955 [Variibacter sp.]
MVTKRQDGRTRPEGPVGIDDLYDYVFPPPPRAGRSAVLLERSIVVTDDWPEVVPITKTELRVIEGHFSDELDAIFGPLA